MRGFLRFSRFLPFAGPALLLALAGCSPAGAGPSGAAPVVTSTAAIAAAAQNSIFVTAIQADAPDLADTLDYTATVATGRRICAALTAGTSVAKATAGLAARYGVKDADVLVNTAADVYCTGQDPAVDAQVNAPGR